MASRGLIKYLGIRNWNLVNVSSTGKFCLRTQQKCSDCGQLLGTTVVVASYKFKDFLSDNQGIREGYFLLYNLFSFSFDILLLRFYISLQKQYTYELSHYIYYNCGGCIAEVRYFTKVSN